VRHNVFCTVRWADYGGTAAGAPVLIADKKPREEYPVLARWAKWCQMVLFLLASAACATVQPNPASASPRYAESSADRRTSGDRNVITRAEILPAMLSAYDVVQYRRPRWLLGRGTLPSDEGQPEAPLVYLEGVKYGNLETLRSINALEVAELRFLDARDATTRFGSGHTNGVIVVTLRRR
jgi:hypothetical protein